MTVNILFPIGSMQKWYIYLHLVDFMVNESKYTGPMDPMAFESHGECSWTTSLSIPLKRSRGTKWHKAI